MSDPVDGLEEALHQQIRATCHDAGFEAIRIEPLRGGLSLRHFARVSTQSPEVPTLVARCEAPEDPAGRPADFAPEPPHEPIRALLESQGLPVPRRLGGSASAGIELLEDVGELSLEVAMRTATPAARRELYAEACAWIGRLQRIPPQPGVAAFERRLDAKLLAYKARLFARDGLAARGREATEAEIRSVLEAFQRISDQLREAPERLAHRDYQSANLFVIPTAATGQRLRMIDFQGAFLAPPEYDAVCLLCDSYVALATEKFASQADTLRVALPDAPDPETFARRFDWLTLTRKGKDYARFCYAARERGDRRYLPYLSTTRSHLRRAARRAAARDAWLAPLAAQIEELPESPCVR